MIELNTLEDISLLAESYDLECKTAGGKDGKGELPKDFWESYSAMANTEGGTVLLGIKEKNGTFQLSGIQRIEQVKKDLFDTANNLNKVSVNLLTNSSAKAVSINGNQLLQIEIRRASRQERPVYLNGNPLGNSYVRMHEGDQRLSDEAVKRLLAEQAEDSRDKKILTGFDIEDLSTESLRVYRQVFTNRQPDHPWNELETRPFLQRIGAWRTDRETGAQGLTAAGLLMFGYHNTIQEAFPYYMLDYQERPEAKTDKRWVDRLTLDGTWSGNLYDFYRKVYPKLTDGLKIPFELKEDQRVDESPVHVAIREALCNALVHADYSDRCSVLIVKRPDLFGFRNPGLMRIPVDFALMGGNADCRNRNIHQMFRYVGIGDQAGSGVPKIMKHWHDCHWRPPELMDSREPYDQTVLRMRMIDLFPQELVDELEAKFGEHYSALPHPERVALAIAAVENTVTHQRLCSLGGGHPSDASRCLKALVARGFLTQTGSSRGAVYHISGTDIPGPEDVFDSPGISESSQNLAPSSPNLTESSPNLDLNSQKTELDEKGRLVADSHQLPFVVDLGTLSKDYLDELIELAVEPRLKRKIPRETMKQVLITLATEQYITISCLAKLVDRDPETLRGQYLSQMVKDQALNIAFPRTPNDPRQAYTKAWS